MNTLYVTACVYKVDITKRKRSQFLSGMCMNHYTGLLLSQCHDSDLKSQPMTSSRELIQQAAADAIE